ncbi:MAG: AAA family ATPase [Flavobacterium sp.]|nr:AAA family ATPase [Flavobacterium sp.]
MKNIIFIGGIHGSGKGTICKKICERRDFVHLTASQILKWGEISSQAEKKVQDIDDMQSRLLYGLNKIVESDKTYLLDGHFCLFNSAGIVTKIPSETFANINPRLVLVVVDDCVEIKNRLEKRDNKYYDLNVLENMQEVELSYSNEIASILGVQHYIIEKGNIDNILNLF